MLPKSRLTALDMLGPAGAISEEWKAARLGKFTSSQIWRLMGERGLGDTGLKYIRERVGEELTGRSADEEIDTPSTRWGHFHEREAIQQFGEQNHLIYLVTQRLVAYERFGSTPDALWVVGEQGPDGYQVRTLEVKCFPSYNHHLECVLCDSPSELKRADKAIYYQVLDQMLMCGALKGFLCNYHPHFKAGSLKIMEFDALDLSVELKQLTERKALAVTEFDRMRGKLLDL